MTPQTATRQASLSLTNSESLLKLTSIESVMPSNHLVLCHPLLVLPSIFPNNRVFSNELALGIRSLVRTPKLQQLLNSHGQENVGSHQKQKPHVQGQRKKKHQEDGRRDKITFRIKPQIRDPQRAQTNLVCTRTQGSHKRLSQTHL